MKNETYSHADHAFGPVIDSSSRILILGSFPSVKSREHAFYYMHPQNRFWKVLGLLFNENFIEMSVEERKKALKMYHIALYDTIEECDIIGSSDLKIRNAVPSDIEGLIKDTEIKMIFCNGTKSSELFQKYHPGLKNIKLPSTSPANAAYSLEKLTAEWKVILDYLD